MKIALGSVQFGLDYGISNLIGTTSEKEVKKILSFAFENGIDTIDTATAYGKSEIVLGSSDLSKFKIVTKIPTLSSDIVNISKWVSEKVFSSIKRMKIDFFYAVLIHNPKNFIGSRGNILIQALHSLKKQGVIKKVGISIYDPLELTNIENLKMIDLIQAPLNIIDRRLEKSGWLTKLNEEGVEIHTRSVFLQGLLLLEPNEIPLKFKKWRSLWDEWHNELKKKKLSSVKECLSYPLSLNAVHKVIVGVNNMKQLKEIISASKTKTAKQDWSFMLSNDQMLINPSNWSDL